MVHLLIAIVLVTTVRLLVFQPYLVPSGSMQPTLHVGDRILVNRLAYRSSGPQPGDLVVFDGTGIWPSAPPGTGLTLVARRVGSLTGLGPTDRTILTKRVIAVGGEKISCCDNQGRIMLSAPGNDVPTPLQEPYVHNDFPFIDGQQDCTTTPRSQRCFGPYRVPKGMVLLLGDNRSISNDALTRCRSGRLKSPPNCVRWVPESRIIGRIQLTWWPIRHLRIW